MRRANGLPRAHRDREYRVDLRVAQALTDADRLAQMSGEPAQGLEFLAGRGLPADAAHGGYVDDPFLVVDELGRQRVPAAAGNEEVLIERVVGDERVIGDEMDVGPLTEIGASIGSAEKSPEMGRYAGMARAARPPSRPFGRAQKKQRAGFPALCLTHAAVIAPRLQEESGCDPTAG